MPQKKHVLNYFASLPKRTTRTWSHAFMSIPINAVLELHSLANLSCLVNLAPSPNFDFLYNYQVCVCVLVFTGLYELIHDNTTESKRTINILQRMNIYQEVFLSILYRILPIQVFSHFCFLCKIHLLGFCRISLFFPILYVCVCLFVLQTYLEPIYFYIYTVFALQTVYVIALFITSWLLSDSWLAGALSGVWYILNRCVCTISLSYTQNSTLQSIWCK